ncbi:MAG TPA: hypothetical protein VKB88_41335 [Bryobacteraceae bacterium]|nr:hypothetical protein [Bryobacteraceae bacterium]
MGSAVSLVNPYGWNLHRHILECLNSSWILSHVQEFQPPEIRTENMPAFAALLVAGVALGKGGGHPPPVRADAGVGAGAGRAAVGAPCASLCHCSGTGNRPGAGYVVAGSGHTKRRALPAFYGPPGINCALAGS